MLEMEHVQLGRVSSGLVMYPEGHARNTSGRLDELLRLKFQRLASHGVQSVDALHSRFSQLPDASAADIQSLYDFDIGH